MKFTSAHEVRIRKYPIVKGWIAAMWMKTSFQYQTSASCTRQRTTAYRICLRFLQTYVSREPSYPGLVEPGSVPGPSNLYSERSRVRRSIRHSVQHLTIILQEGSDLHLPIVPLSSICGWGSSLAALAVAVAAAAPRVPTPAPLV